MKRKEFTAWELSDKAFAVYSSEDGVVYMQDSDDKYYIYFGGSSYKELGKLEDVNAYFEAIADEEE